MAKVEIYTQPWCPFCERAMHILSTKNVAFQEIDAPHGSPSARTRNAAPEDAPRCRKSSSTAGISAAVTTSWRWIVRESWTRCCGQRKTALALSCFECQGTQIR